MKTDTIKILLQKNFTTGILYSQYSNSFNFILLSHYNFKTLLCSTCILPFDRFLRTFMTLCIELTDALIRMKQEVSQQRLWGCDVAHCGRNGTKKNKIWLILPVSARVWLRPHAAATITLSARASIILGASTRLVSPWPSCPLSLRPFRPKSKQQVMDNSYLGLCDTRKKIKTTNERQMSTACYLPQLHSLPSVVMRRLCAAQGPDTTQLTLTSFRQP